MPQISEFPELTTLADNDLLLIWDNSASITAKVQLSTLKTFLGTTNNTDSNTKELTYTANGDANGLCYFLGTNKGSTIWQNPTNLGLVVSASSIGLGVVDSLVDRQDSELYTNSEQSCWVKFKLPGTKLKCNYYSIKTRNASGDYYPKNWKLQGSNDDSTRTDLDTQLDNITLHSNSQWLSIPINNSTYWEYFRLLVTKTNSSGSYHLVLGEVEFYGVYDA